MSWGIGDRVGVAVSAGTIATFNSRRPGPVPSLILDFAGTGTLDSRITFTRSTTGTYYNSSGVLSTAAINAARFDYNPSTLAPLGLLIEQSSTNSLTYSSTFTNIAWYQAGLTLVGASTTAPDNTLTGTRAYAASNNQTFQLGITFNGSAWTGSIFAKYNGINTFKLNIYDNVAGSKGTVFNIQTGAIVSNDAGVTSTITDSGNGWYRCTITRTPANLSAGGLVIDNTKDIFIWGAQLEALAFATSYIPTTTAQVTRAADVASITGANFSSWYNQAQGSLFLMNDCYNFSNGPFPISISDGTSLNLISISNTAGKPEFYIVRSSVQQVDLLTSNAMTINVMAKNAVSYNTNNFANVLNGGTVATNFSGNIPTVNRMTIGSTPAGTQFNNGHISKISYYPTALTSAQLQALTT